MPFKYDGHFVLTIEGKEDVKRVLAQLKQIPPYYIPMNLYRSSLKQVEYNFWRETVGEPPSVRPDEWETKAGMERYQNRWEKWNAKKEASKKKLNKILDRERERNKKIGVLRAEHKAKFKEKHAEALRARELYNMLFGK